jgi:hypothetical protein
VTRTRSIVIFLLIATLMASLPLFLFHRVPAEAKDYVLIVLGWFTAKGSDAIAYLINSTQDSGEKNQTIHRATEALAARAAAPAEAGFEIPAPPRA